MAEKGETFADALRTLRSRAGLTQQSLAEQAGLSLNAVSALERGERCRPYPHTVRALSTALSLEQPEAERLRVLARPPRGPGVVAGRLPVPRQLPAAVTATTGRDQELAGLDAMLDPAGDDGRARCVVVCGPPGVGKTTLAVSWAHRVRDRFPDGQLYVDLRGYGPSEPAGPAEVLDAFLRALDVAPEKIPAELPQRAALFRSLTADARLLVVLDNAGSAEQVRPLLPGSASTFVLVTSRSAMTGLAVTSGAGRLRLEVLSAGDAADLLVSIIGREQTLRRPAAVAELARLCGNLPLALQLSGQRAAAHPDLSLDAIVAELADESQRLELLSLGEDLTAATAVFSWSYRRLTEPQARLFRLVGLHPGPDLSVPVAAALTGEDRSRARRLLHELAEAHLVEPAGPDRYRMHDLLRAYARRQAEADPGAEPAVERLIGYYRHKAADVDRLLEPGRVRMRRDTPDGPAPADPDTFAGYDDTVAWCEQELTSLVAVTRLAADRHRPAAWQIPHDLWSFLHLTRHRTEWMQLVRIGLATAERAGDLRGCAHMHNDLATASDPPAAVDHLTQARELYERIGDRHGVMVTLVNLGNAVLQLGRPAECVDYSRQALAEGIGEAEPYAASAAECNLGKGYAALGRHADAVTTFHRALRLCRLSGNPVREAVTLINLGESCLALGHRTEAAERLTAGLEMCRRARYRYGVARALDALGRLQYESGAAGAAAASWREAATVFAHLGERRAEELLRRLRALDPADRAEASALTPAERRIAELVGAGLTNREAAAAAYVSTKTVEVTLTRVYRKLRVRNRTELANQLTHPGGPQM